jgi:hypothetical protein
MAAGAPAAVVPSNMAQRARANGRAVSESACVHPFDRGAQRNEAVREAISMSAQAWLVALSGGLAGAVLTQLSTQGLAWWRRPKLRISFSVNEPGCVVDTPADFTDKQGVTKRGQQRVLRVRVSNDGRTTARRAGVAVIEIMFHPSAGGAQIVTDDVLDLGLAIRGDTQFELPPGTHRFVDLFFVDELAGQVAGRFAFTTPLRFLPLGLGTPGSYSMRVMAMCDDRKAVKQRADWQWDGSREGLTAHT